MTDPTDTETQRALRSMLADRICALTPPTQVYDSVRRRHRRTRAALLAGTAVTVAAAVAVPTVVLRDRPDRAPTAAVVPPPAPSVSDPASPDTCVWEPAQPAPGLRPQRDVAGSLGGDPRVVTAVLRVGWAALSRLSSRHDDPATARVRMVTRDTDGWIVAAVTATSRTGGWPGQMVVSGPDVGHLSTDQAGMLFGDSPPQDKYVGGEAVLGQTSCQRTRIVAVVPPGSTGTATAVTWIAADLTPSPAPLTVPFGSDGVAVFAPPTFDTSTLVELRKDGRLIRSLHLGGSDKRVPGPSAASILVAAQRAPGDGDAGLAQQLLTYAPRSLPVTQTDVRVLWKGTTSTGATVAAAVSTLPSGARYVWGGMTDGRRTYRFDGLLAADRWDRTAIVYQLPLPGDPLAIFVAGEAEVHVRHGDSTGVEDVTGGKIDPNGDGAVVTAFTRDGDRRPLEVVSSSGLAPAPGPTT